jgi:hypothetical protein
MGRLDAEQRGDDPVSSQFPWKLRGLDTESKSAMCNRTFWVEITLPVAAVFHTELSMGPVNVNMNASDFRCGLPSQFHMCSRSVPGKFPKCDV